jgi:2'-5' RNA ligase
MERVESALFERLILTLASARGRERAITLQALADAAGVPRREVEEVIEHRLAEFPFVLVAGAAGYFIPNRPDDINAYLHNLHSRHRRMQLREAVVRRKARAHGWPEEQGRFVAPPAVLQQELFA